MDSLSLVSLLTPLFSTVMIARAASLYWKRQQTWRELVVWVLVWTGIGLVAFYPALLDILPPIVGIKSGVNVLIFFGFILLFYGFFRIVVKVEELEKKIVMMNRERALLHSEKQEVKNKDSLSQ